MRWINAWQAWISALLGQTLKLGTDPNYHN